MKNLLCLVIWKNINNIRDPHKCSRDEGHAGKCTCKCGAVRGMKERLQEEPGLGILERRDSRKGLPKRDGSWSDKYLVPARVIRSQ
jgi:hypothetical protein